MAVGVTVVVDGGEGCGGRGRGCGGSVGGEGGGQGGCEGGGGGVLIFDELLKVFILFKLSYLLLILPLSQLLCNDVCVFFVLTTSPRSKPTTSFATMYFF
jgi:hypothetical protein